MLLFILCLLHLLKGTNALSFLWVKRWVILKAGLETQKQQLVGLQKSFLPLQVGEENSER